MAKYALFTKWKRSGILKKKKTLGRWLNEPSVYHPLSREHQQLRSTVGVCCSVGKSSQSREVWKHLEHLEKPSLLFFSFLSMEYTLLHWGARWFLSRKWFVSQIHLEKELLETVWEQRGTFMKILGGWLDKWSVHHRLPTSQINSTQLKPAETVGKSNSYRSKSGVELNIPFSCDVTVA